ncbi:glycosyltransferase family A protein [Parapedobacter tibetensis]|uniref:glycosyltransferase family A protein n=1 Tax=Parapedobacter tibetensis TaxID=2972951 RepID=UPI00214D49AC|nr:glycosyltransferase family 2 protein [Parapedobacter tibetensis]
MSSLIANHLVKLSEGISVIICTFNGALKLKSTLDHLMKQKTDRLFSWEILLIDNSSTDNSLKIAKTYWAKKAPPNIKLTTIVETSAGKYYALQQGISHANYEFFVICDDDNWLHEDYLLSTFNILKNNPSIGAVGGYATGVTDAAEGFPNWFSKVCEGYAVGPQCKQTGYVSPNGHLWGAGLASRTLLYREIYSNWPSLLLKSTFSQVMTTEDTEFCYRLTLANYRLYYDESMKLSHFIPKEKLTIAYKTSLYANFIDSRHILSQYQLAIKITRWNNKHHYLKITHYFFIKLGCYLKLRVYKKKKNIDRQRLLLNWLKKTGGNRQDFLIDKILRKASSPHLSRLRH